MSALKLAYLNSVGSILHIKPLVVSSLKGNHEQKTLIESFAEVNCKIPIYNVYCADQAREFLFAYLQGAIKQYMASSPLKKMRGMLLDQGGLTFSSNSGGAGGGAQPSGRFTLFGGIKDKICLFDYSKLKFNFSIEKTFCRVLS